MSDVEEDGDKRYPGLGAGEILSCVARADPRNRLWGMTVAPKIPTARISHEQNILGERKISKLTRIKCARCKDILGRKETIKSFAPVDVNLGDDHNHAD